MIGGISSAAAEGGEARGYHLRSSLEQLAEVKGVVRYLTRDMFFATTWLDR